MWCSVKFVPKNMTAVAMRDTTDVPPGGTRGAVQNLCQKISECGNA